MASGEGNIPSNILKEDDWDVKSFPNLHPNVNGLKQKRSEIGLRGAIKIKNVPKSGKSPKGGGGHIFIFFPNVNAHFR